MAHRVFAYGSLTAREGEPAVLAGHRLAWNVAMDNSRTLPGYKHYLDERGARPAVFVTFVSVEPHAGGRVHGALIEVDDLAALDARERNYRRARVTLECGRSAWCYVGSSEGRARFERGARSGAAVVDARYLESVPGHAPSPPLPVIALTRVDH